MSTTNEVLKGAVSIRFTACGTSFAEVEDTTNISLQSNYGSILIHGDGWAFDLGVIYPSDLLSGSQSVIGIYEGQRYTLKFTRKAIERYTCLSLDSVELKPKNTVNGYLARLLERIS